MRKRTKKPYQKGSSLLPLLIILLLIAGGIAAYQFKDSTFIKDNASEIKELVNIDVSDFSKIDEIEKEVVTPGPLRGRIDATANTLTRAGVFSQTNQHRSTNGVAALKLNSQLNAAAAAKLNDMIAQQYFEHIGPDGRGPSNWVDDAGYAYIKVGENLALGNFEGDAALVQAWMDSPGHRANILESDFTEIGIAVAAGRFEGQQVWVGVQTFGLPSSTCPTPDPNPQQTFQQSKDQLANLEKELDNTKSDIDNLATEIEQLASEGQQKIDQGNQKIQQGNQTYEQTGDREQAESHWEEGEALQKEGQELLAKAKDIQDNQLKPRQDAYNDFVNQYNTLRNQTQSLVDEINEAINTYNTCVKQFQE